MTQTSSESAELMRLPSQLLCRLVDGAELGIVALDATGAIVQASPYAEQLLGQTLKQRSFESLVHPEDQETVAGATQRLLNEQAEQQSIQAQLRGAGGEWIRAKLDVQGVFEQPPSSARILVLVRDVTGEQQASLRQRFLHWVDEAPLAIFRCDILGMMQAGQRLFAEGVDDFEDVRARLGLPQTVGKYIKVNAANQYAVEMFEADDESELLRRFPELLTPATFAAIEQIAHTFMGRGGHWSGTVPHQTLSGRTLHMRLSVSLTDVRDVFVCGLDVTDLVSSQSAKLKLDSQLEQLQKLESLGVLAGGIAHDFNNLLQAISGNAELLKVDLEDNTNGNASLGQILNATNKASALCEQMLAYAGRATIDKEWRSLNDVIYGMRSLLESSVSGGVLKMDLGRNLPRIHVDGSQLRQLLLNLVTNAAEAWSRTDGEVLLRTYASKFELEQLQQMVLGREPQEGFYTVLEVVDNGEGMSEAKLARIFDPFFTTKFTGRGLGLATVLGIVRSHGGLLSVSSVEGQGTTFRVLIPTALTNSMDGVTDVPRSAVLVVDDNEYVLNTMTQMLDGAGYATRAANCGSAAIEMVKRDPSIGLVVLDVTMPGMSGVETLDAIRVETTTVPVILVSGYSAESLESSDQQSGYQVFLKKPFSREKLVEVVHSFLGEPEQQVGSI